MANIQDLTDILLKYKGSVSILECRSGWRVYINDGGYGKDGEPLARNIAYSTFCNDSFIEMLEEAVKNLIKRNKINELLERIDKLMERIT